MFFVVVFPLEIRNANTIGDFVKKCITWMKDL